MTQWQLDLALMKAAESGDLEACLNLLQQGADLKASNADFRSALHLATAKGHLDICRALVEHGSDVNYSDGHNNHWKPLHIAAFVGHPDICRFLLEKGAEVDLRDSHQQTPLVIAARRGHVGVCRVLLAMGADLHAVGDTGRTPLEHAVSQGQIDVVRYLLDECGESVTQPVAYDGTLEHMAESWKQPAMAAFLRAYRNSLNTMAAVIEALPTERNDSPAPARRSQSSPP